MKRLLRRLGKSLFSLYEWWVSLWYKISLLISSENRYRKREALKLYEEYEQACQERMKLIDKVKELDSHKWQTEAVPSEIKEHSELAAECVAILSEAGMEHVIIIGSNMDQTLTLFVGPYYSQHCEMMLSASHVIKDCWDNMTDPLS